ncbi:hypothetical protein M5K25_017919 [Dendrobium thyrsiflorum]|uniref:Uncharacterized protein n=1 Tax=Dendrobium thyrsiflorum TaxID=117978 RepID=A0ABD0UHB4_DENTH
MYGGLKEQGWLLLAVIKYQVSMMGRCLISSKKRNINRKIYERKEIKNFGNYQLALAQQEETHLSRDPPLAEDVRPEHLHAEIPLPQSRDRPMSQQDIDLVDIVSSTHPSHLGRPANIPLVVTEDFAQPHVAEIPCNTLRNEL